MKIQSVESGQIEIANYRILVALFWSIPLIMAVLTYIHSPLYFRPLLEPVFETKAKAVWFVILLALMWNTVGCLLLFRFKNKMIWGLVLLLCIAPTAFVLQVAPVTLQELVPQASLFERP